MTLEKMIKCCGNLTPTESQLAQYILRNKEEVQTSSIQSLSEKTFASKSAIHRFCKKIGFEGFNDLKVKIAKDLVEESKGVPHIDVNFPFTALDNHQTIANKLLNLYETTIEDTYQSINLEDFNEFVKLLYEADYIDIYTHGHNMNVAKNFQDKMRAIGRKVTCPKSAYDQRMTAVSSNERHVAVIISYSLKATFLPSVIDILKDKKVEIILIGRLGNKIPYQSIQHYLYISDRENLRNRISQFSSHIAMQYMLDLLFSCIFKVDYDENIRYIEEIMNTIDDREIDYED